METLIKRRTRSAGSTLLELVVAMAFLTIVLLGVGAIFLASQRSHERNWEEAVVTHSFRHTLEQIRATEFSDVAVLYQGFQFKVDSVADGIGTVTIFVDESAGSADAGKLGLPRDLDGDGSADNPDVTADYSLLPIKIEVSWTNPHGAQSATMYTLLSEEG